MNEKIFAIGDIHGCLYTLMSLLNSLPITSDDIVVFLGDYVDRGPHSRKVLDFLIELKRNNPHWVFLRGNHEEVLLDYFIGKGHIIFHPYTMLQWIHDDEVVIPRCHLQFLNDLEDFYETDRYFFVHGGVDASKGLKEQTKEDLLWTYNILPGRDDQRTIVRGHQVVKEVELNYDRNFISVDTGCCFKEYGHLSAIELPSNKVYRQTRLDQDNTKDS